MKLNQLFINGLLAMVGFLTVYYFQEIKTDLKRIQVQVTSVQVQLKELEIKQESFVTEARVIELIKEYK